MKLITEYVDAELEVITEATEGGPKKYAIEGIFMQSEAKNRNGRIYEKKIMENAVNTYINEQVSQGRAIGELNHPQGPTINLDKVSHKIDKLRWEGNNVIGTATILNTPCGNIVKGLLEGGVKLGVSTRGMGSIEQRGGVNYVKDDFVLSTVDIVQDPSAHDAFVNGIMEGVEFFYDDRTGLYERSENLRNQMRKMSQREISENQMRLFKDYLHDASNKSYSKKFMQ